MTVMGAYSALGFGTFVSLWVVNLLYGIAVVIGLILIIIPGIYLLVRFAFVGPVVVLERSGIGAAFSRSSFLVNGSWWRVFGIGLLIFILFALSSGVLAVVLRSVLSVGTAYLVGAIVSILVDPFVTGALVVLYFDLRIRKGDVLEPGTVSAVL